MFVKCAFSSKVFDILEIENIVEDIIGSKPIISQEYLITSNPNVLIGAISIGRKSDIISSNPILKYSDELKNRNITIIPSDKILRPTLRIMDTVMELYEELSNEN